MTSFEFGMTGTPTGLFDDWDERSYPWLPADDPYQERYRKSHEAADRGATGPEIAAILADPNPTPPCTKPCCVPDRTEGLL